MKDKNGNIIKEPCTCKYCGNVYDASLKFSMELEKQQCFTCWFWISLRTQDAEQPDRVVIVDGAHYCYADDAKPRHMAGFGGQEFRIKFHDGREVVTHNLWYQGKIPEWTKEHFPNNAIFVKKSLAKPNTAQC